MVNMGSKITNFFYFLNLIIFSMFPKMNIIIVKNKNILKSKYT